jgi:hypothetical protein
VIPWQYPTLILLRSDLTFAVSNPKKIVGHKIRMHHSKFRPNKNQYEFLCTLSSDLNISQYLTLKMHNSDIWYCIDSVRVVFIHEDPTLTVNAHHNTRYQRPWFCNPPSCMQPSQNEIWIQEHTTKLDYISFSFVRNILLIFNARTIIQTYQLSE